MSDRKRAEFSSKDMVQDLNRLLRSRRGETVASNTLPELDKQVSGTETGPRCCNGFSQVSLSQTNTTQTVHFFQVLNCLFFKKIIVINIP